MNRHLEKGPFHLTSTPLRAFLVTCKVSDWCSQVRRWLEHTTVPLGHVCKGRERFRSVPHVKCTGDFLTRLHAALGDLRGGLVLPLASDIVAYLAHSSASPKTRPLTDLPACAPLHHVGVAPLRGAARPESYKIAVS